MMGFIKDQAVKADSVKGRHRIALTKGNVPVGCENDFLRLEICEGKLVTSGSVKHQRRDACDVLDDASPLLEKSKRQDDECPLELIDHHCPYNLDSLSKSHLVGKQPTTDTMSRSSRQLLLEKPVDPLDLVVLLPQVFHLEPAEETLQSTLGRNVVFQVQLHLGV